MDRIVGIGEFIISNNKEDIIKTFALASCVAVTAYCSSCRVAGMIHIALPSPLGDVDANVRPGYYANTGLPLFIYKLCSEYGCAKRDLRIDLYGGSDSINIDIFQIGKKNIAMVKRILMDMNILYNIDETGGNISRTLLLDVATGTVKVITQPIRI